MNAVEPRRAVVPPRIVDRSDSGSLRLEGVVGRLLDRGRDRVIVLGGPPGSGKSTALAHLACVFAGRPGFIVTERADMRHEVQSAALVVCTASLLPQRPMVRVEMAAWGLDEAIEFLLATEKASCVSVMDRLRKMPDLARLGGIAELWAHTLRAMIRRPDIATLDAVWDSVLADIEAGTRIRRRAGGLAVRVLRNPESAFEAQALAFHQTGKHPIPALLRLLRHRLSQVKLAAGHIAADLKARRACTYFAGMLAHDLIRETGRVAAGDAEAAAQLEFLVRHPARGRHAAAASILHAAGSGWRPENGLPCLAGALLERADWPGIDLSRMELTGACMERANLAQARLDEADAHRIDLRHANLAFSSLRGLKAVDARMSGADLQGARAIRASLAHAGLREANFEGACLAECNLHGADLTGARLMRADLSSARLEGAALTDANFRGARLDRAELSDLRLREAEFGGATFVRARLERADLEGMSLPGVEFFAADLTEALLTATYMPKADLREARLCGAGLADVEWEYADLRRADLRGATFHMGSSRSGLVGSPLACEGSRTGFYTDDYLDQTFKSAEEIRKANLRGADLRGAVIDGVDFYLVDLRDARYDAEQREHFRRCGAILESRVQGC